MHMARLVLLHRKLECEISLSHRNGDNVKWTWVPKAAKVNLIKCQKESTHYHLHLNKYPWLAFYWDRIKSPERLTLLIILWKKKWVICVSILFICIHSLPWRSWKVKVQKLEITLQRKLFISIYFSPYI